MERTFRNALLEKWRAGRDSAFVLVLVAMCGGKISAVNGTVNRDFALRAAADGADFFAFRGTETAFFSFFTNGTRQKNYPHQAGGEEYSTPSKTPNRHEGSGHDYFVMKSARRNDQENCANHAQR